MTKQKARPGAAYKCTFCEKQAPSLEAIRQHEEMKHKKKLKQLRKDLKAQQQ